MAKTKTSSAVKQRYNEKAYDRLAITIPKGRKATVEACAAARGESINGMVNALLMDAAGLTEAEWKTWNVHVVEKENLIDPDTMDYHDSEEALSALDGLNVADIKVKADTPMEAINKAREGYEPVFHNSRMDYRATLDEKKQSE